MIFSGFTADTAENLLLDAGAYFKNFDVTTDTFETAVTANKLIGATQGGGSFNAVPTIRQIEIDGVKGTAKGLEAIDKWDVDLNANVKEVSQESIKLALAVADSVNGPTGYKKITARNSIALTDYIDNITWVGRLSGSLKPVIIQVFNAINAGGLKINMADKAEAVIAMNFVGRYAADALETPPFAIYYPDETVV